MFGLGRSSTSSKTNAVYRFLKAGLGGPASPSRKPDDNQLSRCVLLNYFISTSSLLTVLSTGHSPIIPDNQPRFTELKEEEIKAVAETPVKAKEGDNQLPPTPPQSN